MVLVKSLNIVIKPFDSVDWILPPKREEVTPAVGIEFIIEGIIQ